MSLPDLNGSMALPTHASGDAVGRILEAAGELFAEHGYQATSMHAVAERANVSKANIFHHFKSKRELYLAVVRNVCEDSAKHLEHLESQKEAFPERFGTYAANMLGSMLDAEQMYRLIQRELLTKEDDGLAKEMAERAFGDKFERLVAILRNEQARGQMRADINPAIAAIVLISANVFFLHSRKVFKHFPGVGDAAEPDRYVELVTNILLRGLLACS